MATDFYLISKSQNVLRLQGKNFIIHFPASLKRPICGKYATYRKLNAKKMWPNEELLICEDCLTHAGEH